MDRGTAQRCILADETSAPPTEPAVLETAGVLRARRAVRRVPQAARRKMARETTGSCLERCSTGRRSRGHSNARSSPTTTEAGASRRSRALSRRIFIGRTATVSGTNRGGSRAEASARLEKPACPWLSEASAAGVVQPRKARGCTIRNGSTPLQPVVETHGITAAEYVVEARVRLIGLARY